jgi:hypothetical protein
MRLINLIIRKNELNGQNRLGVIFNGRTLINARPTDEEMDQIQKLVMEIAARTA